MSNAAISAAEEDLWADVLTAVACALALQGTYPVEESLALTRTSPLLTAVALRQSAELSCSV